MIFSRGEWRAEVYKSPARHPELLGFSKKATIAFGIETHGSEAPGEHAG
jgi:hypothetical protein